MLAHHEITQPVGRHDQNLNIVFLHSRTIEFLPCILLHKVNYYLMVNNVVISNRATFLNMMIIL